MRETKSADTYLLGEVDYLPFCLFLFTPPSYAFSPLLSSSGPEAATALRERGFMGIIIGVTGHAQREDIENFERCGVNAVLAKPLKLETLNSLVDRLLS